MSQLLQVACRGGFLNVVEGVGPPTHYDQGIPYDGDGVAVSVSFAIDHWHQGLPFNVDGRLAVTLGPPQSIEAGPIPINLANNRVTSSTESVPSNFNGGVPYGLDGGLVTGAFIIASAFDLGFSNGFF